VVWQPSVTEAVGDPYFDIASDPGNPGLFDANYRQFDVEGYRIYRGRTRAQLELVAQFDYSGTTFVDYVGAWAYQGKCAPELGILDDCPSFPESHELVGEIPQVPPGGRVELAGGNFVEITDAEIGQGDGDDTPPLSDLNPVVVPGSVTLQTEASGAVLTVTDDGGGNLSGDGTGTVDYTTGAIAVTFTDVVVDGTPVLATYFYTIPAGSGEILITETVNAVEESTCAAVPCPALANSGVPFAFVDNAVVNSTNYFYAVSSFDVNSIKSGPGSLESPLASQSITPRAPSPNSTEPGEVTFALVGRDDVVLDPTAVPTLDATTGTFSGPAAPTSSFTALAAEIFADALQSSSDFAYIRIDSVIPSYYHASDWFLSGTDATGNVLTSFSFHVGTHLGEEDGTSTISAETLLPANQQAAGQVGLSGIPYAGKASAQLAVNAATFISRDAEFSAWTECWFYGGPEDPALNHNGGCTSILGNPGPIRDEGGSRWFDGDNETMADPTLGQSWGQLTGVDSIYHPIPYGDASDDHIRRPYQASSKLVRAADMKVYWGSTPGTVDSVIDVTHNVPILFDQQNRAAYGFVTDNVGRGKGSIDLTPDGIINYFDYAQGPCFIGMSTWDQTGCEGRVYSPVAVLGQVDVDGDASTAEGPGFAMVLAGEVFFFQTAALPSAPAVWTLRTYAGLVSKDNDGAGNYVYFEKPSNPAVPGLRIKVSGGDPRVARDVTTEDLENVHTVPDPYYVTNGLEVTPSQKILKFVNLPTQAIIRIYSVSGILVDIVEHNDVALGGEATWDVRNRNNQFVASGVYFYHVETPTGAEKLGRFTVVNSKGIAVGTPTGQ
jgi:hypothetical protein